MYGRGETVKNYNAFPQLYNQFGDDVSGISVVRSFDECVGCVMARAV